MTKEKKTTINVQGSAITILSQKDDDFICLTDMAKKFGGDDLIYSWIRNRNTLEFLGGIWSKFITRSLMVANSTPLKKKPELPRPDRLKKLNTIAIQQLKSLTANPTIKKLGDGK